MGAIKQIIFEEWQKETEELDREHAKLGERCPFCFGEMSREDCEAYQHALSRDD
jgi:hypothetical protein